MRVYIKVYTVDNLVDYLRKVYHYLTLTAGSFKPENGSMINRVIRL